MKGHLELAFYTSSEMPQGREQECTIGQIMPHKYVHALILQICEYATLLGKRDLADLFKAVDVKMKRLLGMIQSNHMSPLTRRTD